MIFQCPGQDSRNIKSADIRCLRCGYSVEIFSDELKRKCPGCGELISRQSLPSCVNWCPAARECIGEKRWAQFKKEE